MPTSKLTLFVAWSCVCVLVQVALVTGRRAFYRRQVDKWLEMAMAYRFFRCESEEERVACAEGFERCMDDALRCMRISLGVE